MNNWILIVGILIAVAVGFGFMVTITGDVITGAAVKEKVVDNEYFRIDDFGVDLGEKGVIDDGGNIGGSG